jgi:hypothetical protein
MGIDEPLFNPDDLVPKECAHCGATQQPDDEKAFGCVADRDRDQYPRRPRHCLNTYDPATAELPF